VYFTLASSNSIIFNKHLKQFGHYTVNAQNYSERCSPGRGMRILMSSVKRTSALPSCFLPAPPAGRRQLDRVCAGAAGVGPKVSRKAAAIATTGETGTILIG